MKVAVIGSRSFTDYKFMCRQLDKLLVTGLEDEEISIISGGARGADTLAARYATEKGLALQVHLPQWETYGKSAGFKRNHTIIKECDFVVAFWDGQSKGTLHSIRLAEEMRKPVTVVHFRPKPGILAGVAQGSGVQLTLPVHGPQT